MAVLTRCEALLEIDVLDGGAGADLMEGGAGDDTYIVDDAGDQSVEGAVTPAFTVPSGWTLLGSHDFDGDGETDAVVSNGSSNQIWQLQGGAVVATYALPFWSGWLLQGIVDIDGGGDKDALYEHSNGTQYGIYLNGFAQAGMGYVSGQTADAVGALHGPALDGGEDSVQSSISYTLPDGVENLTLTGTGDIKATGNDLDNTIVGNTSANILTGDLGDELFKFKNGSGDDSITDLTPGANTDDRIDISAFGFSAFDDGTLNDVESAATQVSSDVLIQLDGNDSVTLLGVQLAELHEDDFIV